MKCCSVFIGTLIGCLLSNKCVVSAISKPFGLLRNVNNNLSSKLLQRETHDVSNNRQSIIATNTVREDHQLIATNIPRGGACSDSSIELFAKIGVGSAVEAILMFLALDKSLNLKLNDAKFTRIIQAVALLSVIFASSVYGSVVDSGLSAASKQFLDPNEIPGDADWYACLKKPSWNPPGWLFPIMWLIVSKPTQFMAVWKLITQQTDKDNLAIPLLVYVTHLSLGDAWNKVFFGLECTGKGLVVILAFWSVLLMSAVLFYNIDQAAGLLMLPTLAWVSVATALQWSIYNLNKDNTCG